MTKQQFTSGTIFYIREKKYKGDSTYYYSDGHISRQTRSSIDDRIILDSYECNILKVGRTQVTCFTYVLGKRVVVKLKFADLVEFKTEEA